MRIPPFREDAGRGYVDGRVAVWSMECGLGRPHTHTLCCCGDGCVTRLSPLRWAGYKVHLAEEPESELITAVEVRPASEYDADAVLSLLDRQEQRVGLHPGVILTDGAYGTAEVRAAVERRQIGLVTRLRPITDTKHLGKDEYTIDLAVNEGQCDLPSRGDNERLSHGPSRPKDPRPTTCPPRTATTPGQG